MNKSKFNEWFHEIKKDLLVSEPQNIAARAQCCQNIINESISHLNMQLGLSQLQHINQYKCNIDPRSHLKFLIDWPGLRLGSDSAKAPRSKREYEKKAKNWLNGRRAPNYGKTLFPHFISEAEQYSNKVTKFLIPNDKKKQSLYYKILIYKVLAQLCGCSVSLNEQAKKAPFFCKNSIERKGKLKEILQAYAYDHQYIQGFPSCFEEAIDYFENKSNQYFAQYRDNYMNPKKNHKQESSDDHNDNNNKPKLENNDHSDNNNIKSIPDTHSLKIKRDSHISSIQIPPKMPKIEPATPSPSSPPNINNNNNIKSVSHSLTANHKDNDCENDDNIKDKDKPKKMTIKLPTNNHHTIHGQIRSPRHVINPPSFNNIHQPPRKRPRIDVGASSSSSSSSNANNNNNNINNNGVGGGGGGGGGNNGGNNNNHNLNNSMFNQIQFWKNRANTFEHKLKIEEERRKTAEKERDQYKSVLSLMQQNLNMINNNNNNNIKNNNNNNGGGYNTILPSPTGLNILGGTRGGISIQSNPNNGNAIAQLFVNPNQNKSSNNNNNNNNNNTIIATPSKNQQIKQQPNNKGKKRNAFSPPNVQLPTNIQLPPNMSNVTNIPLNIQHLNAIPVMNGLPSNLFQWITNSGHLNMINQHKNG